MLPAYMLSNQLFFLTELSEAADQPNGNPIEALYCGTFHLADRNMVLKITEAMLDEAVRNFNALDESGRIPISVNHRTGAGTLEEARAIGWIVRMFKKTENGRTSLMLEPKWLDDARAAIEQGHFRFVSCGLMLKDTNSTTGEAIGMHVMELSVTNVPAVPGLAPITLTALNSAEKVALSVQAVLASGPMASVALADGGMLPNSLKGRVECVTRSFYAAYPDTNEQVWVMRDMSADLCIVSRRNRDGERTWQLGYSMNQSGGCDFQPMNQWTEVRQIYVPVTQPASMAGAEPEVELAAKKKPGKGKKKPADGDGMDTEMPAEGMEPRGRMGKMVKTCNEAKKRAAALSARVDELIELRNYARDGRGRFASGGGARRRAMIGALKEAMKGKGLPQGRGSGIAGASIAKEHYAAKVAARKAMSPADRKASQGKWKKVKGGASKPLVSRKSFEKKPGKSRRPKSTK